jgi:WD40-like Beta Propeller Repeat
VPKPLREIRPDNVGRALPSTRGGELKVVRLFSSFLHDSSPAVLLPSKAMERGLHVAAIKRHTAVLTLFAAASLSVAAEKERPGTFSMPGSILLFGTYDDLRVVTPEREIRLKAPADACGKYNGGYFAPPTISPRGDVIAWGFCTRWDQTRRQDRARFALGFYSVAKETWEIYGDFDVIGTATFSPNGSKIAFLADQDHKAWLFIFDVTKRTWADAPYPKAGIRTKASIAWSPDETRLAVEILRGGLIYSPQMPEADANRNPVIGVLTLATGELQTFGEGFNPSWSPDGEWIAYYAPGGATLLMMHANGSGLKAVKRLKQGFFSYGSFVGRGPVWSPDSKQLVVTIRRHETRLDIMLIDPSSGRAMTRLKKVPVTPYGWVTQPDG